MLSSIISISLLVHQLATHVSSAVVVSTFAGCDRGSYRDGQGTEACFYFPHRIAMDRQSNFYIPDTTNNRIRKIDPTGHVTTIAGTGSSGQANGHADVSTFSAPYGVFVGPRNGIYITDMSNTVRKIKNGQVTQYTKPEHTNMKMPQGMTMDANNNLYVASMHANRIVKVGKRGAVTVYAGTGSRADGDGDRMRASFAWPSDLVMDKFGNMYIADTMNHCIRKILKDGSVLTIVGDGMEGDSVGDGFDARLRRPKGIAIDHRTQTIYISDTGNNKIKKLDRYGIVSVVAGTGEKGKENGEGSSATFAAPEGIVYRDGTLYVVDVSNHAVRRIELSGTLPLPKPHAAPKPVVFGEDECAVCLNVMARESDVVSCDLCGKSVHAVCGKKCGIKCPMCRGEWDVAKRGGRRLPIDDDEEFN